jgi:hypothetical protein
MTLADDPVAIGIAAWARLRDHDRATWADCFQSIQAVCRAWKASSIKRSGLSRSLYAFIGKDATDHRRPYTSRTPGCGTSNAGCNRMRPRYQGGAALLEHRRARRCRRASHRHAGAAGIKPAAARAALKYPGTAADFTGRGKKAWASYQERLGHLASAARSAKTGGSMMGTVTHHGCDSPCAATTTSVRTMT